MAKISINIVEGTLTEEDIIVGIDLGTTNSLIARIAEGKPEAIADFDKDVIVPSLIHFRPDGTAEVGETAKSYLVQDPENTIFSVKRLLGESYEEMEAYADHYSYRIIDNSEDGQLMLEVAGRYYTPMELSALILKELKARAEHRLKTEVKRAVITVPAYFNDNQRQATRQAGKLAGMDVLRIVNEPTAAALAYGIGLNKTETKTIAVYDLGGGTFDISLLRLEDGIFDVLATNGDTYLGGDDIDRSIVDHWIETYSIDRNVLAKDKELSQALRLLAESAKKRLSDIDFFSGYIKLNEKNTELKLDYQQLHELAMPIVQRSLDCCVRAMADANISKSDIDTVVLVGGSTRMPTVKEAVSAFFLQDVNDSMNPDEVVALGAAIQADILAGNRQDLLLLDVTPLSLGIETGGGLMDVIINRNSKVPISQARQYTTSVDGQLNLRISVYQGERELVKDNRKLGEFELKGIPAMPAGLPKVEVQFILDADGILKVEAIETRSGVRQHIDINAKDNLTDEATEEMLMDSMTNAKEDLDTRMLIECKNEANQNIYYTTTFLQKNGHLLTEEENSKTRALIDTLRQKVDAGGKDEILAALDALDDYTKPFAEKAMDDAVQNAMVGKTIDGSGE